MDDIELSEASYAAMAEAWDDNSDDDLVQLIVEAMKAGWWNADNGVHDKLDPANPPWWWTHAIDGSQAPGTTADEEAQIMTVTSLTSLLHGPSDDFTNHAHQDRIARLELEASAIVDKHARTEEMRALRAEQARHHAWLAAESRTSRLRASLHLNRMTPDTDRSESSARACGRADTESGDSEFTTPPGSSAPCSGDDRCLASPHWHGCHADDHADCDDPTAHDDTRSGDHDASMVEHTSRCRTAREALDRAVAEAPDWTASPSRQAAARRAAGQYGAATVGCPGAHDDKERSDHDGE